MANSKYFPNKTVHSDSVIPQTPSVTACVFYVYKIYIFSKLVVFCDQQ